MRICWAGDALDVRIGSLVVGDIRLGIDRRRRQGIRGALWVSGYEGGCTRLDLVVTYAMAVTVA